MSDTNGTGAVAAGSSAAAARPAVAVPTCACGFDIIAGSRFCRNCGAAVDGGAAPAPAEPPATGASGTLAEAGETPIAAAAAPPAVQFVFPPIAEGDVATTSPLNRDLEPALQEMTPPKSGGPAPGPSNPAPAGTSSDGALSPSPGGTPAAEGDIVDDGVWRATEREVSPLWRAAPALAIGAAALLVLAFAAMNRPRAPADVAPTPPPYVPGVAYDDKGIAEAAPTVAPEDAASADNSAAGNAVVAAAAPTASAGRPTARPTAARPLARPGPTRPPASSANTVTALPTPLPPARVAAAPATAAGSGASSQGGPLGPPDTAPPSYVTGNPLRVPRTPPGRRVSPADYDIQRLTTAIDMGGDDLADNYLHRGQSLMRRGDRERASADFQSAISAYEDMIRRGDRVPQATTGLRAAQDGLRRAR